MNRPFPLPEDIPGIRKARPAVYLHRAAAAHLRSFVTGAAPTNAAKAMFGNDVVTDLILRAATTPAAISGTQQWAQSLAGVAIFDLIQSTASLSAAAEVIDRGLKLDMSGIAEYRVPGRVLNAAAAGQWVGEGMAAPVRALSISNAAILRPRKLQVLTTYTHELAEHSNIEAVVRQTPPPVVAVIGVTPANSPGGFVASPAFDENICRSRAKPVASDSVWRTTASMLLCSASSWV